MNFSENYSCKLAKEIQSYHFWFISQPSNSTHRSFLCRQKNLFHLQLYRIHPTTAQQQFGLIWIPYLNFSKSSSLQWTPSTFSLMDPPLSIDKKRTFSYFQLVFLISILLLEPGLSLSLLMGKEQLMVLAVL